jgi:hypothetical protein
VLSVPRLRRAVPGPVPALDPDGAVLVTGPAWVARHLVRRRGVRRLLVVGSPPDLTAELDADPTADVNPESAAAPTVEVITSAADRAALAEALTRHQVRAVLLADGDAELAWRLHELVDDSTLFAVLTDAEAVHPGPGESRTVSDAAWLTGLVEHRRAAGLPGIAIAWGAAEGLFGPVEERDAGTLLDAALGCAQPVVVAAPLRTADILDQGVPPLFRELVSPPVESPSVVSLDGLDPDERERVVLDVVRAQAAAVLGHADATSIGRDQQFHDVGFDSMTAVQYRDRLNAALGTALPATAIFDHATPAALTRHVLEVLIKPSGPLRELAALEAAIAADRPDEAGAEALSDRLRTLLAALSPETGTAARDESDQADADREDNEVSAASVDELFELIDTELGRSAD